MDKNKKRLAITIAENILKDLEKIAEEKGLSKSAIITLALDDYMKGQKKA